MAIYRGPGGAGDATTDSTSQAIIAVDAAADAEAAAAAALVSQSQAATSATNAATSASTASTAATNASNSASSANTYATSAATSATSAATSASNASTSATNAAADRVLAGNSATAAATSATAAASSATSASNSATTATNSANSSAASASAASTSASSASTSATNAATSASSASTSATNAATSATNAAASEANALTYRNQASTSATNAATSEANALTYKNAAATSATNAATSATSAAGSATSAASAQIAAETARDQTLSLYDSFDDRYLGTKTSDPTLDNDGNALVAGALYFNSTDGVMKVYTGSAWVAAYASLSGALMAANNLSDLVNVTTARTNLGLGSAALVADNTLVHLAGTETITGAKTFSSTITGSISGNAATATTATNQSGGTVAATSISDSGNLAFTGTGNRITGDMSNATISNRLAFQTSTTNSSTALAIIPNGTAQQAQLNLESDTALANGTTGQFNLVGTSDLRIISGIRGTGSYIPITFWTGGSERMRLDTSGNLTLSSGTANGVAYLNGSKVLTTGSALTFDGSSLSISASVAAASFVSSGSYSYLSLQNSGGATKAAALLSNSGGEMQSRSEFFTWTDYNASTERMRLTSTGLGIGTSTISSRLQVVGTNTTAGGTDTVARFLNGAGGTSTTYIRIGNLADNSSALGSVVEGLGNTAMVFNNNLGSTSYERMRIDSSGNVGIGTSSPGVNLDIYKASSDVNIRALSGTSEMRMLSANGGYGVIGSYSNMPVIFATNAAERMRIDSSGYILMNTSVNATNAVLQVAGAVSSKTGNYYALLGGDVAGSASPTTYYGFDYDTTNNVMRIDALSGGVAWRNIGLATRGGNVGIGTSSPTAKLHISGGTTAALYVAGGAGSTIRNAASSGSSWFVGTNVDSYILHNESNTPMLLTTNGTERMRISAGGNVGVGTSNAYNLLTVGKISYGTNGNFNGGTTMFELQGATGSSYSEPKMVFTENGNVIAGIAAKNSAAYVGGLIFTTNGTAMASGGDVERMRIGGDGNVSVGTASNVNGLRYFDVSNTDATTDGSGAIIRLISRNAANTGSTTIDFVKYKGYGFYISNNDTHSSNATIFGVGGSERMRIDSGGRVQIGATSETSAQLYVNGSGTAGRIKLNGADLPMITNAFDVFTSGAYAGAGRWGMFMQPSSLTMGKISGGVFKWVNFNADSTESELMRIDSSGNLLFNSGYGSVATAYGCRAWVNFNGTGTVAIRASGNVSSITDNGTGDYTVNFSTAMPDANYSAVGNVNDGVLKPTTFNTGSHRINTPYTTGTFADQTYVDVAIFR